MLAFIEAIPAAQRRQLRERHFAKGEAILRPGDYNSLLYIVDRGSAVSCIEDADGRMAPVDRYGPGDIFGELEIFVEGLRSIGITASEPCVVYTLQKEYLLTAMEADFSFTLRIIAHLAERIPSHSATNSRWSSGRANSSIRVRSGTRSGPTRHAALRSRPRCRSSRPRC